MSTDPLTSAMVVRDAPLRESDLLLATGSFVSAHPLCLEIVDTAVLHMKTGGEQTLSGKQAGQFRGSLHRFRTVVREPFSRVLRSPQAE